MDGGGYGGLFERGVFGYVNGHLEFWQDILSHQERFTEHLVEHGDDDVPIAEHWRFGQFEFRREDAAGGQRPTPVFHAIALAVLQTSTANLRSAKLLFSIRRIEH